MIHMCVWMVCVLKPKEVHTPELLNAKENAYKMLIFSFCCNKNPGCSEEHFPEMTVQTMCLMSTETIRLIRDGIHHNYTDQINYICNILYLAGQSAKTSRSIFRGTIALLIGCLQLSVLDCHCVKRS